MKSRPPWATNLAPSRLPALSLKLKVSLLILILGILIMTLLGSVEYFQQRERALESMSLLASQTGQVIEYALQKDMWLSDFESIQSTFNAIGKDDRIKTLYLLDTDGRVIFAPDNEGVGVVLDNQSEDCQPCHKLPPSERPSGIVATDADGQRFFRSMHPIENQPECYECHDSDNRINGLLLTDFSISPIESALAEDLSKNIIWRILTAIVMVLVVNFAINRMVFRRIDDLGKAITSFGLHDYLPRLPEKPNDEIGKLSTAFNAMTYRVVERTRENEALSSALQKRVNERGILLKQLINAQEEERKRVARELHDELGQGLSSTALSVELAQRHLDRDTKIAAENLERARQIISESTEHMYDLILGLRPSALDDLGLEAALRAHAQRTLEPAGIAFDIRAQDLTGRLSPQTEIVLFRVFQEALTNVVRHSNASHVALQLGCKDGHIEGEITDNGVGFNPALYSTIADDERGLGLMGMRERVEQFGGEIDIQSEPSKGTRIIVHLPIEDTKDG